VFCGKIIKIFRHQEKQALIESYSVLDMSFCCRSSAYYVLPLFREETVDILRQVHFFSSHPSGCIQEERNEGGYSGSRSEKW
jgi:hypothetical protein